MYLEHTKYYESATSFWKWSAYATLSATLRDNCFRRQGDVYIYPNIYVLLLAQSAVHRKGNPVKLCEELVKKVGNTKLISGRSSIQAILDELGRGESDPKTGKLLKGGSALFSVPELTAGIVNDPEAVKILTDIYDFREEYTSRLRGTGTFRIKNVCFSMLAASNEELLRDLYDTKAIFGGLLGRTFLVKADEFRPGNSLFTVRDNTASFNALVAELGEIAQLHGEFEFTESAMAIYDRWYLPFRQGYKNKPDKSGLSGRIHTSILKLAMLICVDKTKTLEVDGNHVEEAIDESMALIPNYNSFVMAGGKSSSADIGATLLQEMYESPDKSLPRKIILQRHWSDFNAEDLDKCVITMCQAGLFSEIGAEDGITYGLTKKCLEILKSQNEGK